MPNGLMWQGITISRLIGATRGKIKLMGYESPRKEVNTQWANMARNNSQQACGHNKR